MRSEMETKRMFDEAKALMRRAIELLDKAYAGHLKDIIWQNKSLCESLSGTPGGIRTHNAREAAVLKTAVSTNSTTGAQSSMVERRGIEPLRVKLGRPALEPITPR